MYKRQGLGLAISRKLVEAMGGKLSVSSEIGRGSDFHIDLEFDAASEPINRFERRMGAEISQDISATPNLTEVSPPTQQSVSANVNKISNDVESGPAASENEKSENKVSGLGKKVKILIVEDNEINQTVIKTCLLYTSPSPRD